MGTERYYGFLDIHGTMRFAEGTTEKGVRKKLKHDLKKAEAHFPNYEGDWEEQLTIIKGEKVSLKKKKSKRIKD